MFQGHHLPKDGQKDLANWTDQNDYLLRTKKTTSRAQTKRNGKVQYQVLVCPEF